MKLLPICQYYRCRSQCCQFQYQYHCQYNIGQSNGFYRCVDVKNMADTDTDINIGGPSLQPTGIYMSDILGLAHFSSYHT